MKIIPRTLGLFIVLIAISAATGHVMRRTVAAAGFTAAASRTASIQGTFGQPVNGRLLNGQSRMSLGFWDGESDVNTSSVAAPATPSLLSNAPNPFHASTTIRFELNRPGDVELRVFAQNGSMVRSTQLKQCLPGMNEHAFPAGALPAGTYVYTITGSGTFLRGTMTALK